MSTDTGISVCAGQAVCPPLHPPPEIAPSPASLFAVLNYAKADSVLFMCMDDPNDSNDATSRM